MEDDHGEDGDRHRRNIFFQLYDQLNVFYDDYVTAILSVGALKVHLLIYFLFVMVQLMQDKNQKDPPPAKLIFIVAEGFSIIFGMMAVTANTASFLLPLIVMSWLECTRFIVYVGLVILHMQKISLYKPEWLPLPDLIENGLDNVALILCLLGLQYFLLMLVTVLRVFFAFQSIARREAAQLEREREVLGHVPHMWYQLAPFRLPIHGGGAEAPAVNVDSPPNYSLVVREAPETIDTAKEETSPPRYSRIERGARR